MSKKRHLSRRVASVAAVLSLVSIAVPSAAAFSGDDAAIRLAIATAWREHIEAAQRGDLDAVMRLYADDAIYTVPGVHNVRGRNAIRVVEQRALEAADVVEAEHTTLGLRAFGELAYELGTVTGPVRPRGQASRIVTFHYIARWRRGADGRWRISYLVGEPEPAADNPGTE